MTSKVAMIALLVVACAALSQAEWGYPGYHGDDSHHDAHTSYKFEYGVHDAHTGDIKSQYEHGDGHGTVKGSYSLVEPDGTKRVVEYTADPHNGFNAVVKRHGHAVHAGYGHNGHY